MFRLYQAVFGRAPDAEGFAFWVSQYRDGASLKQIAAEFTRSGEWTARYGASPSPDQVVDAMYRNVLDRPGDSAGRTYWIRRLADGMTVAELLVAFAESPENISGTQTTNPLTLSESGVFRLYRAVFGRAPDAEGFAFWVSRYRDGASLKQIAAEFTRSAEWTARYGALPSPDQVVDAMYRNVLGRPGDSAGRTYWIRRLADGMTVAELLVAFAESPENIVRTGTIPPLGVSLPRADPSDFPLAPPVDPPVPGGPLCAGHHPYSSNVPTSIEDRLEAQAQPTVSTSITWHLSTSSYSETAARGSNPPQGFCPQSDTDGPWRLEIDTVSIAGVAVEVAELVVGASTNLDNGSATVSFNITAPTRSAGESVHLVGRWVNDRGATLHRVDAHAILTPPNLAQSSQWESVASYIVEDQTGMLWSEINTSIPGVAVSAIVTGSAQCPQTSQQIPTVADGNGIARVALTVPSTVGCAVSEPLWVYGHGPQYRAEPTGRHITDIVPVVPKPLAGPVELDYRDGRLYATVTTTSAMVTTEAQFFNGAVQVLGSWDGNSAIWRTYSVPETVGERITVVVAVLDTNRVGGSCGGDLSYWYRPAPERFLYSPPLDLSSAFKLNTPVYGACVEQLGDGSVVIRPAASVEEWSHFGRTYTPSIG